MFLRNYFAPAKVPEVNNFINPPEKILSEVERRASFSVVPTFET